MHSAEWFAALLPHFPPDRLQGLTEYTWQLQSNNFSPFIWSQQGLCDLHARSGAALPVIPCSHHVFVLRFHPQTLQEGPSAPGTFTESLLCQN